MPRWLPLKKSRMTRIDPSTCVLVGCGSAIFVVGAIEVFTVLVQVQHTILQDDILVRIQASVLVIQDLLATCLLFPNNLLTKIFIIDKSVRPTGLSHSSKSSRQVNSYSLGSSRPIPVGRDGVTVMAQVVPDERKLSFTAKTRNRQAMLACKIRHSERFNVRVWNRLR